VPHPDYGLKLKILGVVRCDALQADDVPAEGLPSRVILDEAYRSALNGVEVGDFLYVLVIFHLPGARGPTDSTGKECVDGAFSIRTSVRPNLIGMTLSKVTAIDGMEIYFEWLDFVDGTPVIDLKRYSWRWECALSTRRFVNGQVFVPAGGQVKVPTSRVDQVLFRVVPPLALASRMR
jgi:tRNA (Thr-GGU) A37 N-methylase